ncbi:MAG: aldehyde dehydrogenase family protein [Acidobacteria bacterium]|nr:aldehyde dehydrogenase family protein [Acidobacteriota bacterium]
MVATSGALLVGGRWIDRDETIEVRNPLDGTLAGRVPRGTVADVDEAIRSAVDALRTDFPVHARCDVLLRAAALIEQRQDEYAWHIAAEGSKTIREARREPPRAAQILRLAAEEGRRLAGETLPFDSRVGSENRVGYYFRVPVGVIGAITPFNDPLASAAHKVAPALAGGNAVVLKPASRTPLSPYQLARDLTEAGLPPGRLNVVFGGGHDLGDALVSDPRVRMVTFTGGLAAGARVTRNAGIKKLSLELGSNSAVIVMPDANLDRAVRAISDGAFAQAGQNCLGVQRVLIHREIYHAFAERFVAHVATLRAGSSMDATTDVCAMISEREAERVEQWIREAVDGGATVLAGGGRRGALVPPTVLSGVPRGVRLDSEEAYGPVVSLYEVGSLDDAIQAANAVNYGLHAAIFTERLSDAFAAARRLEVGAVIVNDSTDYRLDVMPFGGTKMSGIGREGIRFALQEMTDTRVVCLNV